MLNYLTTDRATFYALAESRLACYGRALLKADQSGQDSACLLYQARELSLGLDVVQAALPAEDERTARLIAFLVEQHALDAAPLSPFQPLATGFPGSDSPDFTVRFADLLGDPYSNGLLAAELNKRVAKQVGYGLSQANFTPAEKDKLTALYPLAAGTNTTLSLAGGILTINGTGAAFPPITEDEAGVPHPAFTDLHTILLYLLANMGGSAGTAPDQVTGLTAGTLTATSVGLSWTAPGNGGSAILTYLVEYRLAGGGSYTTFVHAASTATTIVVTGLANATSYDFRVSALNGVGQGTPSAVLTASTIAALPAQVTGLTAGAATTTTQVLTWSVPYNGGAAITDYLVERQPTGGGGFSTVAHSPSTAASITVTGLTAATSYDYRVSAINPVGTGPASSVLAATTATPAAPTAPTDLTVDADHGASFTPDAGTSGTDYEYQVT